MLNLEERIDQFARNECFITAKDRKENFELRPKFRLLNPAKSSIGKIAKMKTGKLNTVLGKEIKQGYGRSGAPKKQ